MKTLVNALDINDRAVNRAIRTVIEKRNKVANTLVEENHRDKHKNKKTK